MNFKDLVGCKYALVEIKLINYDAIELWQFKEMEDECLSVIITWENSTDAWFLGSERQFNIKNLSRYKLIAKYNEIPKEFLI